MPSPTPSSATQVASRSHHRIALKLLKLIRVAENAHAGALINCFLNLRWRGNTTIFSSVLRPYSSSIRSQTYSLSPCDSSRYRSEDKAGFSPSISVNDDTIIERKSVDFFGFVPIGSNKLGQQDRRVDCSEAISTKRPMNGSKSASRA